MKTIWKYSLTDKINTIEMPKGAIILTVQSQKDCPCIWALVNPEKIREKRVFNIYGTGHDIDCENIEYVGTFQACEEDLIFHVFEENKK